MEILFDLQQEIYSLNLEDTGYFMPVGNSPPTLTLTTIDDVKTILVEKRASQVSGFGIVMSELKGICPGDRITVTGRVPRDSPMGSWGVALLTQETETRRAEECQLAQYTSPKSLFSLSHILSAADLESLLMVQTTRWGALNPNMNLNIDNILISRESSESSVAEDTRSIVYSFETDEGFVAGGEISSAELTDTSIYSVHLAKSGIPDVKIFEHEDSVAMYVSGRNKDWDAVDINLGTLGLIEGNRYRVTVRGRADGNTAEGTIITLQGLPGYSWRNNQALESDAYFTLTHDLNRTEVNQWTTLRITTNAIGANVPFYIYGIEVKRLGLL
ncbi:MAG: hypothetical protein FWF81_10800 [Defluviitaleaceae bacterium]|nr:hypothetical protein [Defluviitaleaceae bacterium]